MDFPPVLHPKTNGSAGKIVGLVGFRYVRHFELDGAFAAPGVGAEAAGDVERAALGDGDAFGTVGDAEGDGAEARGKVGLHFVESKEGWKITAVVFSYDEP